MKFIFFIIYLLSISHISSGKSTEWKSLIVSLASAFVSMFCKEQGITVLVSKSLNISYRTKVSKRQDKCDLAFFLFWPDLTLILDIGWEYKCPTQATQIPNLQDSLTHFFTCNLV